MCGIIKKLYNLFRKRKKMGVIVNKENEENDEISRRIAADLRARAAETVDGVETDFAEDAEYLKEMQKTSRFGWVWFVLIALAALSLISIIFF